MTITTQNGGTSTQGSFANARFISSDNSLIDLDLEHPLHGWIPITINEEEYPELWADVVATDVAPYEAPAEADAAVVWRQGAVLSRAQFCLAAYRAGILTLDEAVAAGKGDWPDSFTPLLDAMPEGIDPDEARIIWAGITQVERLHPLFEAVRQFQGMTPEQADAMFGFEQ